MEHDDYWLLHKGFFNKRIYERRVIRQAVMAIISPWVKQMPSEYQVMPLPGDDELKKQIREENKQRSLIISEKNRELLRRLKNGN
jgi:hypothetical protein